MLRSEPGRLEKGPAKRKWRRSIVSGGFAREISPSDKQRGSRKNKRGHLGDRIVPSAAATPTRDFSFSPIISPRLGISRQNLSGHYSSPRSPASPRRRAASVFRSPGGSNSVGRRKRRRRQRGHREGIRRVERRNKGHGRKRS